VFDAVAASDFNREGYRAFAAAGEFQDASFDLPASTEFGRKTALSSFFASHRNFTPKRWRLLGEPVLGEAAPPEVDGLPLTCAIGVRYRPRCPGLAGVQMRP
jgi:hypothetical protein